MVVKKVTTILVVTKGRLFFEKSPTFCDQNLGLSSKKSLHFEKVDFSSKKVLGFGRPTWLSIRSSADQNWQSLLRHYICGHLIFVKTCRRELHYYKYNLSMNGFFFAIIYKIIITRLYVWHDYSDQPAFFYSIFTRVLHSDMSINL